MNTKLRQKTKNNFAKYFFKLMNNAVFRKAIENVRKNRNIKLIITRKEKKLLISEPNHHTAKFCTENLLAIKISLFRFINIISELNCNF